MGRFHFVTTVSCLEHTGEPESALSSQEPGEIDLLLVQSLTLACVVWAVSLVFHQNVIVTD